MLNTTEEITRGWDMLSPFFDLLDADQRTRCEAQYGRITGALVSGRMDSATYREEITRSQEQMRRTVRENMARPLPHLPGGDTGQNGTVKTERRSRARGQ